MRARGVIATCAALLVLATVGVVAAFRTLSAGLPLRLPIADSCVVSASADAPAVELDGEQMANAATISAVGLRRGVPRRAVVVALATAWQESKLENLAGGDRDSIGLFQQRPSQGWGKPEQLGDPRYAANAFYAKLLKIRGWQDLRVTDAAQAVQRSAHPEAYEKWATKSEVLATALVGEATGAVACTFAGDPPSRGPAAAERLAESLRLDWGDIRTVAESDPIRLAVPARDTAAGWQYAHWLVAHAESRGVQRVRYADRQWTAKTGDWEPVANDAATGGERVVAEVWPG